VTWLGTGSFMCLYGRRFRLSLSDGNRNLDRRSGASPFVRERANSGGKRGHGSYFCALHRVGLRHGPYPKANRRQPSHRELARL
jgi:hypothetical protein